MTGSWQKKGNTYHATSMEALKSLYSGFKTDEVGIDMVNSIESRVGSQIGLKQDMVEVSDGIPQKD